MLAGVEWIAVAAVVAAIFFFGGKKVKDWAKLAGEAKAEFEKASKPEEKKE